MAIFLRWCLFLSVVCSLTALGVRGNPNVEEVITDLMSNPGQLSCNVEAIYRRTIPRGRTQVQHVIAIGLGASREDCFHRCCTLGPDDCQYLWIFEDKCFAVSCDHSSRSCEPVPLGRTSRPIATTYIKMRFSTVVAFTRPDHPPFANAGQGQVIQLPQNEVYLYGNSSRDDIAIASYHWDLVSSHQAMPQLQGADSAILHVDNLLQGTYTFRLTVTDSSGQNDSAIVIVLVTLGESHTNVGGHNGVVVAPHRTSVTNPPVPTSILPLPADHPVPTSILPLPADHPVPTSILPLPADHPMPTSISQHSTSQTLLLPTRTSLPSPSQTGQTGSNETGSVTNSLTDTSLTGNVTVEDTGSESSEEVDEYYHLKRNLVKIIVPVLVTVASILIISAVIVTVSVCICSNRKKMLERYKYRKLPDTVEKA